MIKSLFFFAGMFLFLVFTTGLVYSQSCSGAVVCGSTIFEVCSPPDCDPYRNPNCTCSYYCGGVTTSVSCSAYPVCSPTSICQGYVGVCVVSGSCSYVPPPSPTPSPSPGGATCQENGGACFSGIPNCGAVGRPPGVGSCPSGQLCCAPPGGGGGGTPQFCGISAPPPGTVFEIPEGNVRVVPIAINPGVSYVQSVNLHTSEQIYGVPNPAVAVSLITYLGGQSSSSSEQIYRTNGYIQAESQGSTSARVWARCGNGVENARWYQVRVLPPLESCPAPEPVTGEPIFGCQHPSLEAYRFRWTPLQPPLSGFNVQYMVELFRASDNQMVRSSGWRWPDSFGTACFYATGDCVWSSGSIAKDDYYARVTVRDVRGGGWGGAEQPSCSSGTAESDVVSCIGSSWWQAEGSVISTSGTISSLIPTSTLSFLTDNPSGHPGIAIHARGSVSTGQGTLSSKNWKANATLITERQTYSYGWFEKLLDGFNPDINQRIIQTTNVNGSLFESGGTPDDHGYVFYRREGILNIQTPVTIPAGRKVVVLVDGEVLISGNITISDKSNSVFVLISSSDITIMPDVSRVEGIYFTDSELVTQEDDTQVVFEGSVVALDGVSLLRNLGSGNSTTPAERFIHNYMITSQFPPSLTTKNIASWLEVAP